MIVSECDGMRMTTLQNKTALVTGASRGIGRATASAFVQAGAHVLVHYGRFAKEAESLVSEIETKGRHADLRINFQLQQPRKKQETNHE